MVVYMHGFLSEESTPRKVPEERIALDVQNVEHSAERSAPPTYITEFGT
jgi:hypothetical protein